MQFRQKRSETMTRCYDCVKGLRAAICKQNKTLLYV